MRTLLYIASMLALLLQVTACGGKKGSETAVEDSVKTAVAKPIHICDTVYNAIDTLNVTVMANAETKMTLPDSTTMKLRYPSYKGTLNICLVDTGANAVQAQTNLMMQRLGQNEAEQLRITSAGGFRTTILIAATPISVPAQFLAVSNSKIVSGYFTFDKEPEEDAEALLPIIEALRRDMIHAAENFK